MDQRFPLQTSMPSQQRTGSLPDLDIISINSRSASSSPIPVTEDPSQSSSSRSQSPQPASPPQIAPTALPSRPYSPHLLSTTIPNLEQPTPLTNGYRNQVPIEGEYCGVVPVQDDAILPAPPPYSRYGAEAPQKSEAERQIPQLQMIDVSEAVRGLPTVGPDGNVTSSSNSHPPNAHGNSIDPAEPFVMQHSDSEISMQSEQSSTLSANSNRLLMRGGLNERVKNEKIKDNKGVCGINLWWILLAIAFILTLFSIVLGVTLGLVLKQNQKSKTHPPGNPSGDSQNLAFPNGAVLVPLMLVNQSRTCLAHNSTLPGLTGEVENALWACDLPDRQLRFQVEANGTSDDNSSSDDDCRSAITLPNRVGTAEEVEFVITSTDGGPKPKGPKGPIYEGVQPPSFQHQPLHRILDNDVLESEHSKRSADGSPKYEFRVLYTKNIVLRVSTIENILKNVNGSALGMGFESTEIENEEMVWWCAWAKTYIEGMVWMQAANGTSKAGNLFNMTLRESRLSDQELRELFPGSNTTDASKGAISCWKRVSNGHDLVDIPGEKVRARGGVSSEVNRAKGLSEARAVEEIVRRRFRRDSIFKRQPPPPSKPPPPPPPQPQSKPTERTDGTGQCLCEWVTDVQR